MHPGYSWWRYIRFTLLIAACSRVHKHATANAHLSCPVSKLAARAATLSNSSSTREKSLRPLPDSQTPAPQLLAAAGTLPAPTAAPLLRSLSSRTSWPATYASLPSEKVCGVWCVPPSEDHVDFCQRRLAWHRCSSEDPGETRKGKSRERYVRLLYLLNPFFVQRLTARHRRRDS